MINNINNTNKEPCKHEVTNEYVKKHKKIKIKRGKYYSVLRCPTCNLIAVACTGNENEKRPFAG